MVLKIAVIGGGPAGLVTLKYLVEAHKFFPGAEIEAELFEAHDDIGGVFAHQVYEEAELVSSKYLTAFSDFRIAEDESDFITPEKYVQYLKNYADKFDLWSRIHCSTQVVSMKAHPVKVGHILEFCGNKEDVPNGGCSRGPTHYQAVAICSGLNQTPYLPEIEGLRIKCNDQNIESFQDRDNLKVIHSSEFKSRAQFGEAKTVLILGVGETAMDIAHLAVTSPNVNRVVLCHRDGFMHAPKIIPVPYRAGGHNGGPDPNNPNKPLDCAVASLFDTAYVPGFLQRGPLLWANYDAFIKNMAWVISGTRSGFDQWIGGISSKRFHVDSTLICKSDRAMPYISEQWRSKSLWNRVRMWLINVELKPTGGKKIDLAPWPRFIDGDGIVHFRWTERLESQKLLMEVLEGKRVRPDMVVFATGYKQTFPFLPQNDSRYPTLNEATTRGIYRDIDDGMAYIGFVRPGFGAIPPLAELQAQLWVSNLLRSPRYAPFCSSPVDYFHPPVPYGSRQGAIIKPYDIDYKLHCRDKTHDFAATKRAVDQESYAYQLALDIGAAPTWWHVWRAHGAEVFFTWAMGSNFPSKFRLVGPWATQDVASNAAALMKKDGELGKVVRRTGGGVFFFTYTIFPLLIFGPLCTVLNLLIWLWEILGLVPALPEP